MLIPLEPSIKNLLGNTKEMDWSFCWEILRLVRVPCRLVSRLLHCTFVLFFTRYVFNLYKICMDEQYFGLREDQVPLVVIQTTDGQKYLKANLESDQIAPWLKEYKVILVF